MKILGSTSKDCFTDRNAPPEWFPVKSGARHGCILSPILVLVVIDWVIWKSTTYKPTGFQWTFFSQLEDLDFADDLAFLSVTLDHLQEKTDRLDSYAKQTGLTISTTKTQVMSINATPTAPVTLNGEPIEFPDDFAYLCSFTSKDNGVQKETTKQDWGKSAVVSPKVRTFGSPNSIPLKQS